MERVLSGMRPTGKLHLGHLLGALKNWKDLQDEYKCFFFIADWHGLTTDYADPSEFKENTIDMIIDWLAVGIDPSKSTVFIQSKIIEHAELHVILSMITPLSWLERNPTYKEQLQEISGKDLYTYGFLGYPVLQAADILIYKANYVPVGVDQLPHIELTREIARRFNYLYKNVFPEPDAKLTEIPKLPGIDGRKMSKSYENSILLSDGEDIIDEKVRKMITDPHRIRRNDPGDPTVCTVFAFHKIFTPEDEQAEIAHACKKALIGCTDCKLKLSLRLRTILKPIHGRRAELMKNKEKVWDILLDGSINAQKEARKTLEEVRNAIGI